MIPQLSVAIRPAEDKDRGQLANMIHFEAHVHRHLDWRAPLDWLGHDPYIVAESGDRLIAALACPPDPPNIAWVRMFATTPNAQVEDAWNMLWPQVLKYLKNFPDISVAAIPLHAWFRKLLEKKNFNHIHNVIVLAWDNNKTDLPNPKTQTSARPMRATELNLVKEIDEIAFGPIWQNSLDSIKLAFEQSVYASVIEDRQGIVGFQISTPSPFGAHLARLAVHPRAQGQGYGFALVRDLQNQFGRPQKHRVSVNTQDHNLASLALYKKAGFEHTRETYPVYQFIVRG